MIGTPDELQVEEDLLITSEIVELTAANTIVGVFLFSSNNNMPGLGCKPRPIGRILIFNRGPWPIRKLRFGCQTIPPPLRRAAPGQYRHPERASSCDTAQYDRR
jgi:hypothetical protein